MFMSMMKEFKELKKTVAVLTDNLFEEEQGDPHSDEYLESDGETSHDKAAGESSKSEAPSKVERRAKNCSRKWSRNCTSQRKQVQMSMRSLFNLWKGSSKTNYKRIKLN